MPVVSGPKGVFTSVTRRRAREALTDAQQRLRRNAESCERAPAARALCNNWRVRMCAECGALSRNQAGLARSADRPSASGSRRR